MKVYIAASSREVGRVRAAQQAIADHGWTLTLDWLTPMLDNLERGIRDSDMTLEDQARVARADLLAIDEADVLWLLAPRELTKGAWFEAGYAHGTGTPVVVSGGCPSLFLALATQITDTDAEAIAAIDAMAFARALAAVRT